MKKALLILSLVASTSMAVEKPQQKEISAVLNKVGMKNYWSQDISLWVENPGYSKYELEMLGHQICGSTRGKPGIGFYVITFWHSLSGGGKITKVGC